MASVADDAGALLVRAGLIAEEQLLLARQAQASRGGTIGEHLVLAGFVEDEELTRFYRLRMLVPRIEPATLAKIPRDVLDCIPADMAAEFRCVPVSLDAEQNLTVAMGDPSIPHVVDELAFFTGRYVVRAIATQREIAWCLSHYYGFVTPLAEKAALEGEPAPNEAATPATPDPPDPAVGAPSAVPRERGPSITSQVLAARHRVLPPGVTGEALGQRRPPLGMRMNTPVTGPMRVMMREPNPPELAERVGEVLIPSADAGERGSGDELPAVVVEPIVDADSQPILLLTPKSRADDAEPADSGPIDSAAGSVPQPIGASDDDEGDDSVEISVEIPEDDDDEVDDDDDEVDADDDEVDEDDEADEEEVVLLSQPKHSRRSGRRTVVGLGLLGPLYGEESGPQALDHAATLLDPPVPAIDAEAGGDDGDGRREPHGADGDGDRGAHRSDETGESDEVDFLRDLEPRVDDLDESDEDWGPPGTTIPPPLLGALSAVEPEPSLIPIYTDEDDEDDEDDDREDDGDREDAGQPASRPATARREQREATSERSRRASPTPSPATPEAIPEPAPRPADTLPEAVRPSDTRPADTLPEAVRPSDTRPADTLPEAVPEPYIRDTDTVRALEASASAVLETLRALDAAGDRDRVVEVLVRHLANTHGRVAFFAVTRGVLSAQRRVVNGASLDRARRGSTPGESPRAALKLDQPSTFRDVVRLRLPFAGPVLDAATRGHIERTFGASAAEMIALPIAIRGRVVGVLYGDTERKRTFEEHLTVVARTAGEAFERILTGRKRTP